ncbi:hypothetical protein DPEC_G00364090 [Dallia pectoralis]|nr:hypothetical protein DPEC_G00364090 [Dallia pectoralis]
MMGACRLLGSPGGMAVYRARPSGAIHVAFSSWRACLVSIGVLLLRRARCHINWVRLAWQILLCQGNNVPALGTAEDT